MSSQRIPACCPRCGYTLRVHDGQPTAKQLSGLTDALLETGIPVAPGGWIAERHLATLLGITRAALRQRIHRGSNRFEYTTRGNQRFYRLTSVAATEF